MRAAFGIAPLLSLLLVAVAGAAGAPALKAGAFSPPRPAPDFSLRGSDGHELSLSRYRGKLIVLGFGYTSCPNVCPITLATLAQTRRNLGPLAVRMLYGILAEKTGSGSGATVAHSSYTLLIDRSGSLRALMPYGRGADEYAHDLKILLKE
jgi:protein SCO1/2